jgi:arylformamidase
MTVRRQEVELDVRLKNRLLRAGAAACLIVLTGHSSFGGPPRVFERPVAGLPNELLDAGGDARWPLPPGVRVFRDVSYGNDPRQRFDVYAPANASGATVIFMVHGGAWFLGDKSAQAVVENKVAHWSARGFIVVSANYRMLPAADPLEQAKDVARALAKAQSNAASWGGDRNKFILMGHSAGAHLVALLAASPAIAARFGATPWLAAVLLDSAALDVVVLMKAPHLRLYDRVFGGDERYWRQVSPIDALTRGMPPILAVCSSLRADSCAQATRFVAKATSLGTRASVLEEGLSHRGINQQLGVAGGYTDAVESFLSVASPRVGESSAPRSRLPGNN